MLREICAFAVRYQLKIIMNLIPVFFILSSLIAFATPIDSSGFKSYEVSSFLTSGAKVIVDSSFKSYEVSSFITSAKDRVTVNARGFKNYEVSSFLTSGA